MTDFPHAQLIRETTRAQPVDHCIYCGCPHTLTDEHIVPLALGGRWILPKASCQRCAAVTSAFERKVFRGFMLDARTAARFPTRRPAGRPELLPLQIARADDTFERVSLPPDEHPGFMHLPVLAPAAELTSASPPAGTASVGIETISFGQAPATVAQRLNTHRLRTVHDFDLTAFARLLAKIAYAYAVSALGPLPRERVPILPLILGHADDASHWLGSASFKLAVEAQNPLHALGLMQRPDPLTPDCPLLVARVKLFASSRATGYEVIVQRGRPLPVLHL